MPYGLVSKNERRTSNTERPTPNENKYQLPNIEHLFLFLHLLLFNVQCWMFDVLFLFLLDKNNLALMRPGRWSFAATIAFAITPALH